MSFSDAFSKFMNDDPEPIPPPKRRVVNMESSPSDKSENNSVVETPGFSYRVLKILAPKPGKTQKEARALYKQLSYYNIFSSIQDHYELDIDDMVVLCQYTKFEVLRAGKIVYNKDDKSNNKMYLVMNGEIQISPDKINPNIKVIDTEVATPRTLRKQASTEFKRKLTRSRFSTMKDLFKRQSTLDDIPDEPFSPSKRNLSIPKVNPLIITKGTGDYFGESAIFGVTTRKESAYTLRTSELIIIDMEAIMRARGQYKQPTNTHLPLLDWIPGFSQISSISTKEKLIELFELISLDKGATLTTQGERGDHFYIINEGECEAYGNWSDDSHSKRNFDDDEIQKQFRVKKNFVERIKLFVGTPGSVIGEEMVFDPDNLYNYTVKIKSPKASVFRIEKVRYLFRFPSEAQHALNQLCQQKTKTYKSGYNQTVKNIIEKQKNLESLTGVEESNTENSFHTKGPYLTTMTTFLIKRAPLNNNTMDTSAPHELEKMKQKFLTYRKKTDLSRLSMPIIEPPSSPKANGTNADKLLSPLMRRNSQILHDVDNFKLRFEKVTPRKNDLQEKTERLLKSEKKEVRLTIKTSKNKSIGSLRPSTAKNTFSPLKTEDPEKKETHVKDLAKFISGSPRKRVNLRLTITNSYSSSNPMISRIPTAFASEMTTPLTMATTRSPMMSASKRQNTEMSPRIDLQFSESPMKTQFSESPMKTERDGGANAFRIFQTGLPSRQGARAKFVKKLSLKT